LLPYYGVTILVPFPLQPSTPANLGFLALAGLAALALAAGCIEKTGEPEDDDSATECVETETVLELVYVEGGGPWCGQDMPGDTTCFDCHFCPASEGTTLSVQHYVCNYCHNGPSGEVLGEHGAGCGCEGLDCDVEPLELLCQDCHTDGCNGFVSAQVQRDSCMFCHGEDEPLPGE